MWSNLSAAYAGVTLFTGVSDGPFLGIGPINAEAWATLNSDTSRPFEKPMSGRIAVKVINHLGDEVMKVFSLK